MRLRVLMKDVTGCGCHENCDTTFRHSKSIRQSGVEAPVFYGRVAVVES